jgi:hypothetical protein
MLRHGFGNFSLAVAPCVVVLVCFSLALAACGVSDERAAGGAVGNGRAANSRASDMAQTSDHTEGTSADIERLSQQIALPVRPAAALWRQEVLGKQNSAVPGPTDHRLVAVLRYDEEGARALIEKVKGGAKETNVGNVDVEPWFPEEVRKFARKNDDGTTLEGAAYEADSFLRAPYSGGKLVRVGETNYFVLKILSF